MGFLKFIPKISMSFGPFQPLSLARNAFRILGLNPFQKICVYVLRISWYIGIIFCANISYILAVYQCILPVHPSVLRLFAA